MSKIEMFLRKIAVYKKKEETAEEGVKVDFFIFLRTLKTQFILRRVMPKP